MHLLLVFQDCCYVCMPMTTHPERVHYHSFFVVFSLFLASMIWGLGFTFSENRSPYLLGLWGAISLLLLATLFFYTKFFSLIRSIFIQSSYLLMLIFYLNQVVSIFFSIGWRRTVFFLVLFVLSFACLALISWARQRSYKTMEVLLILLLCAFCGLSMAWGFNVFVGIFFSTTMILAAVLMSAAYASSPNH